MTLGFIEIPEYAGYTALFILIFLGEAGVPLLVPAELALVAAGIAAAHGTAELPIVLALALLADVLGAFTLYYIVRYARGRRWRGIFGRYKDAVMNRVKLIGADSMWRIVAGRTIPYLRIPASGAAALAGLTSRRFLWAVLMGGAAWIALFLGGAYLITTGILL